MHQQILRSTLTALCFSLAATTINAAENKALEDTSRLLPEVASVILNLKAPELQELKQNVYVGMLAINAPEDMDAMEIGAQVITNNFALLKQSMQTHTEIDGKKYDNAKKHYGDKPSVELDFKINEENYLYACVRLNALDCVEKTIAQKEPILALMGRESNTKLMQRYMQIRDLPYYSTYYYSMYDHLPSYIPAIQLSRVRLAQALFAFNDGNTDSGFKLLEEEMATAKRALRENDALIGHMVAINMLYTNYHTISALLDTSQMKPYLQDPRLLKLLAPLNNEEQKALSRSFVVERNVNLYGLYMLDINNLTSKLSKEEKQELTTNLDQLYPDLSKEEKEHFITEFEKNGAASDYDRYATANLVYMTWKPIIQRANMGMDEIASLYTQNKLEDLQEAGKKSYLEQVAQNATARKNNPHIPLNITGHTLTDFYTPDWDSYLKRLYDLQAYILLVNTKHQIVSKGLKAGDIDAYLKTAENAAQNPITREPFTWDATAGTLSTPWLTKAPFNAKNKTENGKDEYMPRNAVSLKLTN